MNAQQVTWVKSLYIPRIDFEVTKHQVKDYFEKTVNIGDVGRVDFVSINTENGTGRRVFIHFTSLYDPTLTLTEKVFETIAKDGYCVMELEGHSIRVMINRNPVPPTYLNMDQIASNTEFLADDMKVQQEKVDKLEKMVESLHQKLEEQHGINQQLFNNYAVLQQENAQMHGLLYRQYHNHSQQSYDDVQMPPKELCFPLAPGL